MLNQPTRMLLLTSWFLPDPSVYEEYCLTIYTYSKIFESTFIKQHAGLE